MKQSVLPKAALTAVNLENQEANAAVLSGPRTASSAPAPCKYVHCALTGKVIASRFMGYGANDWDWIAEAVATYCGCKPDDVDCTDTDERLDVLTVKGEVVAFIDVN